MESFFNEKLLPIVAQILKGFEDEGKELFFTTDVIKKHIGHYIKDTCPGSNSINANYGKFLKENAENLGIIEVRKKANVVDDQDGLTSSSEWAFLNTEKTTKPGI